MGIDSLEEFSRIKRINFEKLTKNLEEFLVSKGHLEKDDFYTRLLEENKIPYSNINPGNDNLSDVINDILNKLNESNRIRISDNNLNASEQILKALNNYERFKVDRKDSKSFFCESENLSKFKQFFFLDLDCE